jgi:SAM-dependent methyltransferase
MEEQGLADRASWIAERRRINELRMDSLFAPGYDERWGDINSSHRTMLGRFLDLCRSGPRILDAACGTGKYWPLLLEGGASIVGVDQSGGMLQQARAKHPDVPVAKLGLQEISFAAEFDGAICVDAMENVFPSQVSSWISSAGLVTADRMTADGYHHFLLRTAS